MKKLLLSTLAVLALGAAFSAANAGPATGRPIGLAIVACPMQHAYEYTDTSGVTTCYNVA